MFSFKNKLDPNLNIALKTNLYKEYRVLICFKCLQDKIEKKIQTYRGTILYSIKSLQCTSAYLSSHGIRRLIEYPEVSYITFDTVAYLCATSTLSANHASSRDNMKYTGKNIGIGLVDSGTYPHIDLTNPTNKIIKFIDLINKSKYPYDDNGHGTFVTGILCGSGYGSKKGIYKGIAPGSFVYSIKAFNSLGRGYISDILYGIELLIDECEKFNIKVILLPFEIVTIDFFVINLFSKMFDRAIENNITIVVPAGHNGNKENSLSGIATLENCVTVGGLDTTSSKLKPYSMSSFGPCYKLEKPDISAAAVDIFSLNSNIHYISERNGIKLYDSPLEQLYTSYTGTSCAAAYIAGICALLYEKNNTFTFKDILSLLKICSNIKNITKNCQGAGIIDLSKILK